MVIFLAGVGDVQGERRLGDCNLHSSGSMCRPRPGNLGAFVQVLFLRDGAFAFGHLWPPWNLIYKYPPGSSQCAHRREFANYILKKCLCLGVSPGRGGGGGMGTGGTD